MYNDAGVESELPVVCFFEVPKFLEIQEVSL